MHSIVARAAALGIERDYCDAHGQFQTVGDDILQRLCDALDRGNTADEEAPPVVCRTGGDRVVRLDRTATQWRLATPAGEMVASGAVDAEGNATIPPHVDAGIYQFNLSGADTRPNDATLILAPDGAYQCSSDSAERCWVLSAQLYAIRSRRNWGHGDFTDLMRLVALAADCGAAGVGLNPLHALFYDRPEAASPYSPNSRLFLNSLYIDVEAVPDFADCGFAPSPDTLRKLREADVVDYTGVAAAKTAALAASYRRFCAHAARSRKDDLAAFRHERGPALIRFAAFETLRRRFGGTVWWHWPEQWRSPDMRSLAALRDEEPDTFGYYEYVQWIADRQLAACAQEARRLRLPVGLYVDLAVGVEPGGADAWGEQDSIVPQVEVGAPPDLLNTAGQAWGLAAFNPRALKAQRFLPFSDLLEATMRHAGAIRLDHVLGLNRLFLIPFGYSPRDGAYVRYPLQALLAVVALQSDRQRCIVIGEDLGTVPDALRTALADWGIWSYLVMMFERHGDGSFRMPEEYRRNALVTFNTHDLPTFTGWRSSHDLEVKLGLGLDPGETADARTESRRVLGELLRRFDLNHDGELGFHEIVRFLAKTPSRVMIVSLEDVLEVADQPNIPGTTIEHPNWRRRMPTDLEDLPQHEGLRRIASALRHEGRAAPQQPAEGA